MFNAPIDNPISATDPTMSGLIALDITQQIDVSSLKYDPSSARDQTIINAFKNSPWAAESNNTTTSIQTVDRDLLFQILMVENISKSKQSQLDEINTKLDPKNQRVDRLKFSKKQNNTVISQIDIDTYSSNNSNNSNNNNNNTQNNNTSSQNDMFKFTIQGKNNLIFFAITTYPIKWGNCTLGAKLIVKRGTLFNKNIFILSKFDNSIFLGGINRIWNENRDIKFKEYLTQKLNRDRSTSSLQSSKKRKAPL
ncbi:recQ-mediated genome instability protein 1 [Monosporozyma servazzii]